MTSLRGVRWERFAGPAAALAVAAGSALAARPTATLASVAFCLLWYRADRRRRPAAAAACFFAVCLLAIVGLADAGVGRVMSGLGIAAAVTGRAVSRATVAGDGAEGPVDEIVRRHAIETAAVAGPAAILALLVGPLEAAFGFWGLFFVGLAAVAGLGALLRRARD